MTADPVALVLAKVQGVKTAGTGKWQAFCPIHENPSNGHKRSLSVGLGDDGKVLVFCQAGCATADVVKALGLTTRDLFPPRPQAGNGKRKPPMGKIIKTYDYTDAAEALAYQVVRFDPKGFCQRRSDGEGHWVWGLSADVYAQGKDGDWYKVNDRTPADAPRRQFPATPRVLYRLPELLAAEKGAWIFLTEGEKDSDALAALGLVATTNPGGAGKWKQLADDSALHGRRVAIPADKDTPGLAHGQDAAGRLCGRAAVVKIIDLPDGQVDGRPVKDVTDWLDSLDGRTPEDLAAALVAMAENAPVYDPAQAPQAQTDISPTPAAEDLTTKTLADAILAQDHFAKDAGGKLYIFASGAYQPGGEGGIRRHVKALLNQWAMPEKWTTHRADETVAYIGVDAPELWSRPPLDVLNVVNGLLEVNKRQLRPHDPAHLSAVQLPVSYDPAATCPAWERFVSEVFPSDAQGLPWQLAAWLMLPYTAIQKAVLLIGGGANGKSTFLRGLTAFLGKRNVAGLSLHRLESDKFAAARLVGKLANVCPDLPSAHLAGTSIFKAIVGGDALTGERKYMESFEFDPFARLVFSANHPPRSTDASAAFFRRWLVVPFARTFEPADQIPADVLDAHLADPKELAGVLNKALAALPGVKAQGITESPSMRGAWDDFRQQTDPLAVWLDANVEEGACLIVSKAALRDAYNRDAGADGRPFVSDKAMTQAVKTRWPAAQDAQRTYNGKALCHCWLGRGLRNREPQP